MSHYRFKIKLVGDAELRTGIGGEAVNSYVPKDLNGMPFIPGSHVKGLMRAALKEIAEVRTDWEPFFAKDAQPREWPYPLLDRVFGQDDAVRHDYFPKVRVEAARLLVDDSVRMAAPTQYVSRTELNEKRLAKETSLRTTEAIFSGSEFIGDIYCDTAESSVEALAWRLGLLAIPAVGGARSRNGQCVVSLMEHAGSEPVDVLLRSLDRAIRDEQFEPRPTTSQAIQSSAAADLSTSTCLIELIYIAATPVCFPERPEHTNLITSGFTIPASAVQGSILHLINQANQSLANALFDSQSFRCWPLNPCSEENMDSLAHTSERSWLDGFDQFPRSLRVSLSHRAVKFTLDETQSSHFFDGAFGSREAAYDWLNPTSFNPKHNIPMKATDGVLLFGPDPATPRTLWRSAMMPRSITTHGVIDGAVQESDSDNPSQTRRNLFSVEAMMPMSWRGMIVVPASVAHYIADLINGCVEYRIGKGRSVRGRGRMIAQVIDGQQDIEKYLDAGHSQTDRTAIVLQSPVAIPGQLHAELTTGRMSAEAVLRAMAEPWLKHYGLPHLDSTPSTWASAGIRFGWNRHARTAGREEAVAVLLPGSVFTLAHKASREQLARAIQGGFYYEPEKTDTTLRRGFGCVEVHPGTAQAFYSGRGASCRRSSAELALAMKLVYELRGSRLPRPSQIRAVERRIRLSDGRDRKGSTLDALDYLERQCQRLPEVWHAWEASIGLVERILKDYSPQVAQEALKSLADIAVVQYQVEDSN